MFILSPLAVSPVVVVVVVSSSSSFGETERERSLLRLISLALLQRRDGVLLFFLSFPFPVGGICARSCSHGRDDPAAENGDGAPPEAVEGRQSSHFPSETKFSTSRPVRFLERV